MKDSLALSLFYDVRYVKWTSSHENSHSLVRSQRHEATIEPARMSKWKYKRYKPRTVAFTKCRLRDEPKGRCWSGMALEWRYASQCAAACLNRHDHLLLKCQAAQIAKCYAYARFWNKQSQLMSKRSVRGQSRSR